MKPHPLRPSPLHPGPEPEKRLRRLRARLSKVSRQSFARLRERRFGGLPGAALAGFVCGGALYGLWLAFWP
jgi:hypothetical protein